jgi:dephospho-CoA kinase
LADSRTSQKPVIGLAGGIGSGKSTVASVLRDLGAIVIDSDALSRDALAEPDVRQTLRQWWGDEVFNAAGQPDRRRIAEKVFNQPDERRRLEGLIHPRVADARRRRISESTDQTDVCAVVIDSPLLFETGLDVECDAVVFVDAPQSQREARVARTRGWSAGELARRESAQRPLAEKKSRADFVCTNASDVTTLAADVGAILSHILASHASTTKQRRD